jgi:hypothetical protein
MLVVTNGASEIHFSASRIEGSCEPGQLPSGQVGGANAFIHIKSGKVFLDIEEIEDTGRFTFGLDEFSDTVLTNAPAISGIYWEVGETHARVGKLSIFNGYGLWGVSRRTIPRASFTMKESLSRLYQIALLRSMSLVLRLFRVRITKAGGRLNEVKSPGAFGLSLIGLHKFYWELAGKISGATAIASSSIVWLNAQKITGLPTAATISGGEHHLTVQQWEQGSGSLGVFISISAGNNHFNGGWAKVTNASGPLMRVSGGTNLIQGMVLQTTGAGNPAYPIDVTTSNLTLQDVTLISGSTNSIFATNAQTVTAYGVINLVSNINANVTLSGLHSQNAIVYGDGSGLTNLATGAGDVTTAQLNNASNVLYRWTGTVGTNDTNFSYALGLNGSNYTASQFGTLGTNSTNFARASIGLGATNLANQKIASNAGLGTNYQNEGIFACSKAARKNIGSIHLEAIC